MLHLELDRYLYICMIHYDTASMIYDDSKEINRYRDSNE